MNMNMMETFIKIVKDILEMLEDDEVEVGDVLDAGLVDMLVAEYEGLELEMLEMLGHVVRRGLHEYMEIFSAVDAGYDKDLMVEEMEELRDMLSLE